MARRPVIGISCRHLTYRNRLVQFLDEFFISAIREAGGTPLLLPITADEAAMAEYLSLIDGLMISDGDDVDPALYGESPWQEGAPFDRPRDDFEIALIRRALEAELPIFGVCRGSQVLNVAFGGSLEQDIPGGRPGSLRHSAEGYQPTYHPVRITYGGQAWEMEVNSLHHQAVAALGAGLSVLAEAPDGTVEGITDPSRPFVVGIQWHPERLCAENPEHRFFFREFVTAAQKRLDGRAATEKAGG